MKAIFFVRSTSWVWSQLLLLLLLFRNAQCGFIVKTLPGFDGELPFLLETGYISVESSELFYLFVESTGNPKTDPVLIYLVGGPACSALNGFFYQTGPLEFNSTTDYAGELPELVLRSHPWTKSASIIFLDAPSGTGYSYPTTDQIEVSDSFSARQTHKFIRKWFIEHPQYLGNRFFIATDSYSGVLAPIIVQDILNDNAAGVTPTIRVSGYISGSPHAANPLESNQEVDLAHRLGLIGDKLFKRAKKSCGDNYFDVDASNVECVVAVSKIDELLSDIAEENVLLPNCETISPKQDHIQFRRSLREKARSLAAPWRKRLTQDYYCKNSIYLLSYVWANNDTVQEALGVRKGTVKEWYRCNILLAGSHYDFDISNSIPYHKNLTRINIQVLLYTGDHDLVVPHTSTEYVIKALNLTAIYPWQPWRVDGQVVGYKLKYKNQPVGYRLTYATFKGSGHSPTEYFNRESYEMFERWIHNYPL